MDIEGKDAALGILLIAVVGLSGGLGFVILTSTPIPTGSTETIYLSGLPDDWSTAPNASYIILNNQTHSNIIVTLGEILNEINTYQNSEAGFFDTGIAIRTIIDPDTNIPITGISIIDLLDEYHTYFAGDINFISKVDDYGQTSTFSTNGGDFLTKTEGDNEAVIIAIAANKTWLKDSPFGNTWGNFTLIGEGMGTKICNLEQVNVLNNWTLDVYVDDVLNMTLQPDNITHPSYRYSYTYSYDRSDDWSLNRTFWGFNLSIICDWIGLSDSDPFELKAFAADGWAAPHGNPSRRGLNATEIYHGLAYDSYYWDYINETVGNPDGVPLPDEYDDLPIMLAYSQRILGEYDGVSDATNPVWPSEQMLGMGDGPYKCIIPGRNRPNQIKWINEIRIDTNPPI